MALLFIDGFDAYGTSGSPTGHLQVWSGTSAASANMAVSTGRFTGNSLGLRSASGNTFLTTPNLGNISTWFIGFAFRPEVLNSNRIVSLLEDDQSTEGMNIRIESDGKMSIYRFNTLLATTAGTVFSANLWHNIELKIVVHNSTGSYEVKVNGVTQLVDGTEDTRQGTTNDYANRVRINGFSTSNSHNFFDDFRCFDNSGSANNDWLGDRKVLTLVPTAEGDTINFTPQSGTDNSAMCDENGMDSDTTYVESGTVTDRDLYQVTDLTSVTTINGIQQNVICRKTDVTDFNINLVCKSGATTDVGADDLVNTTDYINKYRIFEDDPNTTDPWTDSAVDSAQFGFDVG